MRVIGGTNEGKKNPRMNVGFGKISWMISGLFRSIKRSISPFVLHLCLSLCKGYGFAGTPPAADPAVLTPSLEKSTREEGKESGVAVTVDLQRILVFIFPKNFQNFKQAFQSNCVVSYSGTAFFLASTGK